MNTDQTKIPKSLGRKRRAILKAHGIHNLAQLFAYCEIREAFSAVAKALSLSEASLSEILDRFRPRIASSGLDFSPLTITSGHFGALVEGEHQRDPDGQARSNSGHSEPISGLPASADLSSYFPPAFDQGQRGTCVAQAEGAAREFEERLVGKDIRLSCQHLYYLCKKHDGHPGSGTYPSVAWERLYHDGICQEYIWPYCRTQIPRNEGQGPPPSEARRDGLNYRVLRVTSVSSSNVSDLKSLLSGSNGCARPASASIPIKTSFGNSETSRTGKVVMPFPGESTRGWHRILLTGYQDDTNAPGGGYFHFRNSWGEQWAPESSVKPGYGLLPYAYFLQYARNVSKMERRQDSTTAVVPKQSRISLMYVVVTVLFWSLIGLSILGHLKTTHDWQFRTTHPVSSDHLTSIMDSLFPQQDN